METEKQDLIKFSESDFAFIKVRKLSDVEKEFVGSALSDKKNGKRLSKNVESALKVLDSDADIFYCEKKGAFYTSSVRGLVQLEGIADVIGDVFVRKNKNIGEIKVKLGSLYSKKEPVKIQTKEKNMGIKIKKTWCFSSDLCEKIKGYALMENKSETQFVADCITSCITHKVPADGFASELKKLRLEIKRLVKKFEENDERQ